ncbi:hypothetical protein AB0G04_19115 [Actinoplanes sp. NPDC023801]|uniref:hypothetical protein n=1 Tax=Actinoplanes sp. NPDC023801 TaxID=3154595 RepID=UPI003401C7E7
MSADEIVATHASASVSLRLASALLPAAWLLATIFAAGVSRTSAGTRVSVPMDGC